MAAGIINLQKSLGGITKISSADGAALEDIGWNRLARCEL